MATVINLGRADPHYPGRIQSAHIAVLALVANTEQHFTAPTGSFIASFSCTDIYYVLTNGQTAAVPAATNTSFPDPNTVPDLNPAVLAVIGGTTVVSVISPNACICVISFYRDTDRG